MGNADIVFPVSRMGKFVWFQRSTETAVEKWLRGPALDRFAHEARKRCRSALERRFSKASIEEYKEESHTVVKIERADDGSGRIVARLRGFVINHQGNRYIQRCLVSMPRVSAEGGQRFHIKVWCRLVADSEVGRGDERPPGSTLHGFMNLAHELNEQVIDQGVIALLCAEAPPRKRELAELDTYRVVIDATNIDDPNCRALLTDLHFGKIANARDAAAAYKGWLRDAFENLGYDVKSAGGLTNIVAPNFPLESRNRWRTLSGLGTDALFHVTIGESGAHYTGVTFFPGTESIDPIATPAAQSTAVIEVEVGES